MNEVDRQGAEKALLLLTLGFLDAARSGAIDPDEALNTVGIPRIIHRMEELRIPPSVASLVSQLDEFDFLKALGGDEVWLESIARVMEECRAALRERPLCMGTRPTPVCLKLLT